MDSTLIGNKSEKLEPGYVFAPYIMAQNTSTIVHSLKNRIRKNKINKIYNLGLESDSFISKSLTSRYSTTSINNNFYGKISI